MPIVLDLIYLALLATVSPWLVYKSWRSGKYREGWAEKLLGQAPRRIGDAPCLWFHAVSVGEVRLLRPLIADLARRRPGWDVVLSTTTKGGLAVARREYPDLVTFYAPLDFSWATRRAVARIRPTALALVELELWPNLVRAAKRAGARVAIINGRLSVRSHRGYRRLRGPLGPTLRRLDAVAAQTAEYAERFVDLGVPAERVHVTGSVKYDGLVGDRDNPATLALRDDLGLDAADVVFVAGSTMEGEEDAALAAYRAALPRHPRLRLVLVPRHPERFDRVARWLQEHGERVVRRSRAGAIFGLGEGPPVVLVDTLGELSAVWGLADVAFVGGSLRPGRGGQNMMEPAAFGAPVLFGPHTSNFRATVESLLARRGARVVRDADDLRSALLADLDDPEAAAARGAAARAFVLAQHGASARTLAELDRLVA
ncbi:MAG TPA: 3-deoxy-D-manno-octulosonic acid transferase [Isosphaeraceae bacterium]|jgi:3-deoxy-D-manno-octulosonic-acid transferase|nr:3-deoxy-D-manno-octulosonic acid transferase [Isosphaeraceae bacterium]